jgi:hypothetical protein
MRKVFSPQMSIGQCDIADIKIDISSRDDIPTILLALQHIYTTTPLINGMTILVILRWPSDYGSTRS